MPNMLTGGMYEMGSARAYRLQDRWYWWCVMVAIDVWFAAVWRDWDHCLRCAQEWERVRGK